MTKNEKNKRIEMPQYKIDKENLTFDNAKIHGNVRMSDDAVVCGNAHLCGDINTCQYQIF